MNNWDTGVRSSEMSFHAYDKIFFCCTYTLPVYWLRQQSYCPNSSCRKIFVELHFFFIISMWSVCLYTVPAIQKKLKCVEQSLKILVIQYHLRCRDSSISTNWRCQYILRASVVYLLFLTVNSYKTSLSLETNYVCKVSIWLKITSFYMNKNVIFFIYKLSVPATLSAWNYEI